MKKILYGIIGLLLGALFFLDLLSEIPKDFSSGMMIESPEELQLEPNQLENIESTDVETYLVNEIIKNDYLINETILFGRKNPMKFYRIENKVLNPGENGEGDIPEDGSDLNPSQYIIEFDWNTFENSYVLPRGYLFGYDNESKKIKTVDVSKIEGDLMQNGKLPVELYYYNISSNFGIRKDPFGSGDNEFHKGLDISSDKISGTNVYSILDGTITFKEDEDGYGKYAIVNHGEYFSIYAHLEEFNLDLENGDTVKAGDIIGFVGNTGRSTGTHLHLELDIDGVRVNPRHFLNLVIAYTDVNLPSIDN